MDFLPCDQCPWNYICKDGQDCPSAVFDEMFIEESMKEDSPYINFVPIRIKWSPEHEKAGL